MKLKAPKPLNDPEALCTGFVRLVATPGPETLSVRVQRPEAELTFALSRDECARLASILLRYLAT